MFRGTSSATLDAKGRMALPARLRGPVLDAAQGRLVVTLDPREKCLLLYPLPQWEDMQKKLEELPNADSDVQQLQRLQRLLIGHATDLELDGSGRVLLPQRLRQHCGLEKALAVVGLGKKIEIWAEREWEERVDAWKEANRAQDAEETQSSRRFLAEVSL